MSSETREAEQTLLSSVSDIEEMIERLKDAELKALAAKIRADYSDGNLVGDPIWEGLATGIDRELDRRKAWKSRKGTWYAVAHLLQWEDPHSLVGQGDTLEYRACDGKEEAVETCRAFLKKYADRFDAHTTVDVEIHPEIEWQSREG